MSGPASDRVLAAYLDAVVDALPARRGICAEIRAELADGLACAVAARIAGGAGPADAAAAAIGDFGPPGVVAAAFARQLLTESAHRVGLGLLFGGPLVGVLWVAAAPVGSGAGWATRIGAALAAAPGYPLLLVLAVSAAVLALAAGRRLGGARLEHLAAPAAQAAVMACVAGDVMLLGAVALAGVPEGLGLLAAAASLTRLSVAALAGRRVARLAAAGC